MLVEPDRSCDLLLGHAVTQQLGDLALDLVQPAERAAQSCHHRRQSHPEAAGRKPVLDPATREIIALAVSATNGCAYCINSHTAALRKLGVGAETLGEVLAIVRLFNTTNTLADAYQVEPDIPPPLE